MTVQRAKHRTTEPETSMKASDFQPSFASQIVFGKFFLLAIFSDQTPVGNYNGQVWADVGSDRGASQSDVPAFRLTVVPLICLEGQRSLLLLKSCIQCVWKEGRRRHLVARKLNMPKLQL